MMRQRKLPIGIQNFEEVRKENYLYVDKTEYIQKLVSSGKVYFLNRPRRFGKSLFISTLEAYFQGKKELFKGLAIETYKEDDKWPEYPIIHFSLSGGAYLSANGLSDALDSVIRTTMRQNGIEDLTGETLPVRFKGLIEQLYEKTGKQVVILVDEYDKPLLETMTVNKEQEEKNRQLYKSFFSVLKDEDACLKFVFFTGVTKFSNVSIFSDLNQLRDISLSNDYSGICGITRQELEDNFTPEINRMAGELEMSRQECLKELARMYDGYHFSGKSEGMYNPFSLLNAFEDRDLRQYWFSTATPTFVVNKLKKSDFRAEQLAQGVQATEMSLMDYQEENPDPIPLLYQSGYLTISGWKPRFRIYTLRFPNAEVEYGFMNSLVNAIVPGDENRPGLFVMNFVEDLESGNIERFMDRLSAAFASIPYAETAKKNYEAEWRNEIYLFLALLGMNVYSEVHTSQGRADCVVETDRYIYLFEFKLDKTAQEAVRQIDEKGCSLRYKADTRKLYKIGVNFSSRKRNIENWVKEN